MWRQYHHNKERWQQGDFKVFEIPAYEAVKTDVITPQFPESEKTRLGIMHLQYYEAKFISATGNNIFESSLLDAITQPYDLSLGNGLKVLAVDF